MSALWPWVLIYPLVMLLIIAGIWVASRVRPGRGRKPAIVISLVTGGLYLAWRAIFTIPESGADLVLGIALFATEAIGFLQALAYSVVAWETGRPKPLALSELPQHPSVDVFIATYNEPLPMLRTTVAGALTMRYPGTVNVYL